MCFSLPCTDGQVVRLVGRLWSTKRGLNSWSTCCGFFFPSKLVEGRELMGTLHGCLLWRIHLVLSKQANKRHTNASAVFWVTWHLKKHHLILKGFSFKIWVLSIVSAQQHLSNVVGQCLPRWKEFSALLNGEHSEPRGLSPCEGQMESRRTPCANNIT